jgi:hypothetical protein
MLAVGATHPKDWCAPSTTPDRRLSEGCFSTFAGLRL